MGEAPRTLLHVKADQIIDMVRATGAGIQDIESEEADLEDVFLALTERA